MQTIKLKRKLRKSRKNNRMSKRDTMKIGGIKRKAQAAALEVVPEVEQKKRSGRCSGIERKEIHTVTLGNGSPASPSYGENQFSAAEIKDFVEKAIIYDIQKVSLPTTPASHTLVVIKEPGIIRIVDWNNKREPKTEVNEDHEEDKEDEEDEEEYYLHSGYEAGKEGLNARETKLKSMLEGKIQNKKKLTKKEKEEMEEMEEKEKNYIKWRQYTILIDAIKTNFPKHEVIAEKVIRKLRKKAYTKSVSCGMGGCSEYIDLWLDEKYCYVLNLQNDKYVFKHM
jgi:hypothetical protein